MKAYIRKPVIAGSWYPGNPEVLKQNIDDFLKQAVIAEIPRKPVAIISPHAGYQYSGQVAAYAYKAIAGHAYSTVVVISPSHRMYLPFVSVWKSGAFETPLGALEVDEAFCEKLMAASGVFTDDTRPHVSEHALEIQLPFLQVVLGNFRLCPLIMGLQEPDACRELARALHRSIDDPDDVLIVASSDLSHFHPASRAEAMDARVAQAVERFDVDGLSRDLERSECEACGGGPILSALMYAQALSRTNSRVLKYAHSGHITGDNLSVVGYLSAVIW
ncbi:MAG: AmmeMemoRadiSam system protein B [Desulfomonilia bacterium]|mgnify:CR=1 FL=1|jgi:AmmeMemoRadiSam system protein B|uniref:MEMO1 family protein BWY87_00091 n=1 Tax=anaerobic digester metagenome TaxID=1263854 RepID=A0A485M5H9_9ZZZZ|nr:AmmeMemoRadiSam system protein B [Pseudomonadota bacterium]HON37890.1 AmmeMemoRadiSam system protein B [Deltaproteobacteria bacterium]HRS56294.1 AmmeMemoRadiSam system protein B [Desulfomonilia bacterium]HPD22327.1 AmmeMemoRadiSam system protein B [Deltaproteobacteria bacterium]HPX18216.1 AmmeMemoRadiSam system protein B [Deltaproteobacteria bacterium]